MRWSYRSAGLILAALLLLSAAAEKPPAQFKSAGSFTGGKATEGIALSGVRFGTHTGFTRMVLDFEARNGDSTFATEHPVYNISYAEHPYRLIATLQDVKFDPQMRVQANPALPFSVVTPEDNTIKEMQIFLSGPSEFKVIEIDDPAKLSIDVKPLKSVEVPTVYTVQLMEPVNAEEAYALVEGGEFPEGFSPSVLVLGSVIIVEQAFISASEAASIDAQLRDMGYASIINERRGDELPQR